MKCPLCHSEKHQAASTTETFFRCLECDLLFRHPDQLLSSEKEFTRYQLHQNDITDPGYQKFVQPTVDAIAKDFNPQASRGLDFGAGPGPVISNLLHKRGYSIALYDPFFHPDRTALNSSYDFIICCEVIEHFHFPDREFQLLSGLIKPGGKLYCQTLLWDKEVPVEQWHYSRDPTHVVFYTVDSLNYIKKRWEFTELRIEGRLITLRL